MGLGNKIFKGVVWSAIERLSVQTVQFIIGIYLARILSPNEYGILSILLVFIAISQVFIDSGFTKALIQKQNRTETDISTVFLFNLGLSFLCYATLWVSSPFIAQFYNIEELSLLLRVLSISLILNAILTVPVTLYTIKLDFKKITQINLVTAIIAGLSAIYFAKIGYGVWALVIQTLCKSGLTAILIWIGLHWKPTWSFSKASLKELFKFGSNLLVSSLLNTFVNKSYELVIAKTNSTSDLGYYTRGTQFSDIVFAIINTIIDRVLLPGLAEVQDKIDILVSYTQKILKIASLLIVPFFLFLAVIAEPLIRVLLTDKWLLAVPIMQIFCIARLITILSGINVNILYVLGRTDLALKQQYIKIAIRIIFLVIALKFGIIYIALAELASTIVHFFINTYHPGKIMKYGGLKQLSDLSPIIISGLAMSTCVYFLNTLIENDILKLLASPFLAIISYIIFIQLFKVEEFSMLIKKVKSRIKK
ncbi:lipopolysaccharide biosynthesis protein [Maribacter sp.]|uniref:lipopolysaccharide biosynthesis protein n=1 Tax=Maribacter sp. TaxID=1897614 RepID=UPI0025B839B1|nr:lipopolysaccharide biosynthesis protein [Maribacter sp.]